MAGKISQVQIDGLVLLKIVKHCKENPSETVTGQLLGFDATPGKLEITQCFPLPTEGDIQTYSEQMMSNLRQARADDYNVGWYTSSNLDSFSSGATVEQQFTHQAAHPKSVFLVHDPVRTTAGKLYIKAFRLTDRFMSKYNPQKGLTSSGFTQDDVFEELPIQVHNSLLVHGFLYELREQKTMSCDSDRLVFNHAPALEKTLNSLSGLVDTYINEHGRLVHYHRQVSKQKAQQEEYLAKISEENKRRKENGQSALPKEDLSTNTLFRAIPPPDVTPDLLRSKQMSLHCDDIISTSSQAFDKLYSLEALQKQPKYWFWGVIGWLFDFGLG